MKTYEITIDGQNAGVVAEESILSTLCSTMNILCLTHAEKVVIVDLEEKTQTTFREIIRETNGSIEYEIDDHDHYPLPYGKTDGFATKKTYNRFYCDSPNRAGNHRTCYREYEVSAMAKAGDGEYSEVMAFCTMHAIDFCKWAGIPYNGEEVIYLD